MGIRTGKEGKDKVPAQTEWSSLESLNIDTHEKLEAATYRMYGFRPIDAGLWVVDLDQKNGKDGLASLSEALGHPAWLDFPDQLDTFYSETPNGLHLYFKAGTVPDILRSPASSFTGIPGVDIRCNRKGWIAAPGSIGFSVAKEALAQYTFNAPFSFSDPPKELIELFLERVQVVPVKEASNLPAIVEAPSYLISEGITGFENVTDDDKSLFYTLFDLAKKAQSDQLSLNKIVPELYPEADWVPEENRWRMGDIYGTKRKDKGTAFISADYHCGEWNPERHYDLINMLCAARNIDKITACRLIVRAAGIPDPTEKLMRSEGEAVSFTTDNEPIPPDIQRFALTDMGNGERLAKAALENFRYNTTQKSWMFWDGKVWKKDYGSKMDSLTREVVRGMVKDSPLYPTTKEQKEFFSWAKASEGAGHCAAMKANAANSEPLQINNDAFELDRDLLNCENGMIHLKTGELIPHEKTKYFLRKSDIRFNPNATCPRFLAFLDEIMLHRADMVHWLQVYFGYCLTGRVTEHVFAFFYGTGRNGKSALIDIIKGIMSSHNETGYFNVMRPESLMVSKYGSESESLASVFGARFVMASESDVGATLSASRIKEIAGGDSIKCRKLYQDSFFYSPTWKAALLTNHKPSVNTQDEGTWRRLRYVPFDFTCPVEKVNKNLADELVNEEGEGILSWLVAGAIEWYQSGLPKCEVIENATQDYREEEDTLSPFFTECCLIGEEYKCYAAQLAEAWKKWAVDNGENPDRCTPKAFGKKMSGRKGFARIRNSDRNNRKVMYTGIALLDKEHGNVLKKEEGTLDYSEDEKPPF
jgi:P4 family phage/plasmid primase-like protien